MSGLEEVFHPSALHAEDEMASEKILPAPAPIPGPPPADQDGVEVIIPTLDEALPVHRKAQPLAPPAGDSDDPA